MSSLTWVAICAGAVAIVPAWTPPAWYLVLTGVLLLLVGVRALNGRV